jgi:hypothetical protein
MSVVAISASPADLAALPALQEYLLHLLGLRSVLVVHALPIVRVLGLLFARGHFY